MICPTSFKWLEITRAACSKQNLEGGLAIDQATGLPTGITGTITFREPSAALRDQGFLAADRLIAYANTALEEDKVQIWLLLDRLDVAFAETHDLERNALRALFRV